VKIFKRLFRKSDDLRTCILSVTGRRQQNEDSCLAVKLDKVSYFLAVADGMGGLSGGKIASQIVISSIEEYLDHDLKKSLQSEKLKDILSKVFLIAQTTIADYVRVHPELHGMGTTLTALLVVNGKYAWANIGDSRIYKFSQGHFMLITQDHSYIQDYLNNYRGEITESLISHYKNVVTKVIDGNTDKPDIYPEKANYETLQKGDCFLLCSDGLILDKLKDYSDFFKSFFNKKGPLDKVAGRLVNWAYENGSDDNISVVLGRQGSIKKQESEKPVSIEAQEDLQTMRIFKEEGENNKFEEIVTDH
jgi:PPM family protein phosphatase